MKQRTKDRATEWLKTAKSKDTFRIDTVAHSKKEIEDLLGGKAVADHKEHINIDIEEELHEDLEPTLDSGDTDID
tara:strand:- start:297 stop:521 length:225 start_codon:yes stop_codon:yes gene_type:complete